MASTNNSQFVNLFNLDRQKKTKTIPFEDNPFNIHEHLGDKTGLVVVNKKREIVFKN